MISALDTETTHQTVLYDVLGSHHRKKKPVDFFSEAGQAGRKYITKQRHLCTVHQNIGQSRTILPYQEFTCWIYSTGKICSAKAILLPTTPCEEL